MMDVLLRAPGCGGFWGQRGDTNPAHCPTSHCGHFPNRCRFESVASKSEGFSYHEHQHPQPRVALSSSTRPSCSLPASAPTIELLPFGSFSLITSQCRTQNSDAGPVTFTNAHNALPAEPTVPSEKEQNNPHPPQLIRLRRRS